MAWVKAALLFGLTAVAAYLIYGVTDNIAVPSAVVFIGVIGACMSVALAGDSADAGPAPASGNPRAAAGAAPRLAYPDRTGAATAPATAPDPRSAPADEGWPAGNADPDTAAWREAARRR
jgi:hypothetical protein